MFKVIDYEFENFRNLIKNKKAMEALEGELKQEKAKRYGQQQINLGPRQDREYNPQFRPMYPDFTKYVENHICTFVLKDIV